MVLGRNNLNLYKGSSRLNRHFVIGAGEKVGWSSRLLLDKLG